MRMRSAMLLLSSTVFLALCAVGSACSLGEGTTFRPTAGYHFVTNSYVLSREADKVGVTCISNLSRNSISAHWFIPAASGWIPPNEVFSKERYLNGTRENPVNGCLEYGNLGETVKSIFIGDHDELEKSLDERKLGCREARNYYHSIKSSELGSIRPIKINLKYYFPYDIERPDETMVQLEGTVTLEPKSDNEFQLQFNFGIRAYGDSDTEFGGKFSASPVFVGRTAHLKNAYLAAAGESYPLEKLGSMAFVFSTQTKEVRIEEAYIDISAPGDVIVARIAFPVYVGSAL